jgi:hypothetical protein
MGLDAQDSISDEHYRREKRYPVPMGQECFTDPDHARTLLHDDRAANWIPTRLSQVTAATGRP